MSKHLNSVSPVKIVILVTSLAVVYFLVSGVVSGIRSRQLGGEEDRLRQEIVELQVRHDRLAALRDYLNSDEFIEAAAREQLGLVREGEAGYIAIASQPSPTPGPGDPPPDLWWDIITR